MATGTITSLKYVDVSSTIPSGSKFVSKSSGISFDRIRSVVLFYSDDVFYDTPTVSVFTNGNINFTTWSGVSAARTYTARVFYE